jgi:hypothetical protein
MALVAGPGKQTNQLLEWILVKVQQGCSFQSIDRVDSQH